MKKATKKLVTTILVVIMMSVSAVAMAEAHIELKHETKTEITEKTPVEQTPDTAETEQAETEESEANATKKSVKIAVKGTARIGKTIKLKATIKGFENEEYKLQWQTSEDGENWEDVENATKKTLKVKITKANKDNLWRIAVNTAA